MSYSSTVEPDENFLLPFGKGKIINNGTDATIVTWGMSCKDSINAANQILKETGKSIEIIDLRTIIPWDKQLVLDSIKKTNRVLIVHEDTFTMGFGAEIASFISSEAFKYLDAPVMRLAAKDSHIPYNPIYEADVLPDEQKIKLELKKLLEF
jgi:2-oxoisovalerate dehydrogenase E1 component